MGGCIGVGSGATHSFLGPTLTPTERMCSSCGQDLGKMPKNFCVDHERRTASDNDSVTIAVIVLHSPPGLINLNLHVPIIGIFTFCASVSLYFCVFGSITTPICLAMLNRMTSQVAPVSGVTLKVAIRSPFPWQPAMIFNVTRGVGAPNPNMPGWHCPGTFWSTRTFPLIPRLRCVGADCDLQ